MSFASVRPALLLVAGFGVLSVGCADEEASGILVELAPEVISSEDGSLHVRTLVIDEHAPLASWDVRVSVEYIDRNDEIHDIASVEGTTDERGAFEAVLEGFLWEGSGTVTVEALDSKGEVVMRKDEAVAATASFAVLDRTPPVVTILPPTQDLHVGQGFPLEVQVQVTDEIGVSEVILEGAGELDRVRSTVVGSGSTDTTVTFDFDIPNDALAGPTITLYALAADLSGNLAAAEPVILTVDPAINFAVTGGLQGMQLVEGNQDLLDNPTALALSPADGLLYVADNSGGACNDACIRVIDPADGSIVTSVLVTGQGQIEGIAFDAAGDELYFTDRENRLMRMTWNTGNMTYEAPATCNNEGNQDPQLPYHLVHDATLGIVVADRDSQRLKTLNTCVGSDPNDLTTDAFEFPWGVAAGPDGEFYVSDEQADRIYEVSSAGDVTSFESSDRLDRPRGIAWLAGGASTYADSLLIANTEARTLSSSVGTGTARTAIYLRNEPVDVEVASDTAYVVTQPSAGDRGRLFVFSGF